MLPVTDDQWNAIVGAGNRLGVASQALEKQITFLLENQPEFSDFGQQQVMEAVTELTNARNAYGQSLRDVGLPAPFVD